MHPVTLCVIFQKRNAERPWRRSHVEREERSFTAPAIRVWDCRHPQQNQPTFTPLPGSSLNASTLINTITAPTITIADGRSANTKEAINIAVGGIR